MSELTGNASVEGTFKWSNPEQTADGSDVTSDAYPVVFTPASTNYTVASGVNLTQTIPFYASTKVAARKVTFADASNGTFIVKVNGAEVKSGAQITEGDKIVDALVLLGAEGCGYCAPGYVVLAYAAKKELPKDATYEQCKAYLDGNLCRCTGYTVRIEALMNYLKMD